MQTPIKILYRYALKNIELGKAHHAYRLMNLAILLRKDLSNLYLLRAKIGIILNRGRKVNNDLKKAAEFAKDKELIQSKIHRIQLEQAARLENIANDTIKKITAPNPMLALHLLKIAQSLDNDGETKRSLRMYDSAVRNMPDSETLRYERAKAYLKAKKYPEALIEFSWIITRNHECCEALIGRGYIKYVQGDISGAILDFGTAKDLDPTSFEAVYNLGIALLENKKSPEQALNMFERALLINPDSTDALVGKGRAQLEMNNSAAALEDFERLKESEPKSGLAWYWIGKTAEINKEKAQAIDAYTKATDLGFLPAFDALSNIRNPQPSASSKTEINKDISHLKRPKSNDEQKVVMYLDAVLANGKVKPSQGLLEDITGIDQTVWSKLLRKNAFWEQLDRIKKERQNELEKQLELLKDWHVLADERRRDIVEERPNQERLISPKVLERTNKPKKKKKTPNDNDEANPIGYDNDDANIYDDSDDDYGGSEESLQESSEQTLLSTDPLAGYDKDLLNDIKNDELRKEILFLDPKYDRTELKKMSREELIQTYKKYR